MEVNITTNMSHTFKKMLSTTGVETVLVVKDLKKKAFSAFKCSEYLDRTFFGLEVSKQAVYN